MDHFSSSLKRDPGESDLSLPRPSCYAEGRGRRGGKRSPVMFGDVLCNIIQFVARSAKLSADSKWTRRRAHPRGYEPRDDLPAAFRDYPDDFGLENMKPTKCSRWTRSLSPGGGRNFLRPPERVLRSPRIFGAKCSAGGFFAPLRAFSHTVVHHVWKNILGPPE